MFEKCIFSMTAQSPAALCLNCDCPVCLAKKLECGLDSAGLEYGSVTGSCKNDN
jgi:hypothetical protein